MDNFIKEIALILRGEHQGYKGDKIINAEHFIRMYAKSTPNSAHAMGDAISKNIEAASEVSGLHPDRCRWIVGLIRQHNPIDHKDNFQ